MLQGPQAVAAARAVVAGAGGFIGGHLVRDLLGSSKQVVAVDIKPLEEWHQVLGESENVVADLREKDSILHPQSMLSARAGLARRPFGPWARAPSSQRPAEDAAFAALLHTCPLRCVTEGAAFIPGPVARRP